MLSLTVKLDEEIRITHGGEDMYIMFSKTGRHLRMGILGPKTFQVKRLKGEVREETPCEE